MGSQKEGRGKALLLFLNSPVCFACNITNLLQPPCLQVCANENFQEASCPSVPEEGWCGVRRDLCLTL